MYITNTRLSSIKFENKDINIIKSLSVGKSNGHENIFISMLKICDSAIVEPLSVMFSGCINQSIFPDIWESSNIYPIHKKVTS